MLWIGFFFLVVLLLEGTKNYGKRAEEAGNTGGALLALVLVVCLGIPLLCGSYALALDAINSGALNFGQLQP